MKKIGHRIVLATHGNFVAGIRISLALICGETKNVKCLCVYMEQPHDLVKAVKDTLKNNQQNELIVIIDLFGGDVNNEFFNYVGKRTVHLISGSNLATLIEIYTRINAVDSLVDLVRHVVENRQESLCYHNELSSEEILEEEFWEEMK